MTPRISATRSGVTCWENGAWSERRDTLAIEEPLEIRSRGRAIAVTMRTPGNDADLAAGFLFTEGLLAAEERPAIRRISGNAVSVPLRAAPEARAFAVSASCGLCGKARIELVHQHFAALDGAPRTTLAALTGLPEKMRAAQTVFRETGGLHAAALFTPAGELLLLREDVGRHNAVDKLIGAMLRAGRLPLEQHILLLSGRASFEILQKALAARIGIVAAIGAPSSLAVQFAEESNQTLIGFLRAERLNIYSHAENVESGSGAPNLLSSPEP